MTKKIILSTLAGAVTLFLLGGLIFGVLLAAPMAEFMKAFEACAHAVPPMQFIIFANIAMALMYSLILNKFGISTFKGGLTAAAWISFLLIFWFDMWMFATFTGMNVQMMVFDILGNTAVGALAGGVIGWVLGKVK